MDNEQGMCPECKERDKEIAELEQEIKDRAQNEQGLTNWIHEDGVKIKGLEAECQRWLGIDLNQRGEIAALKEEMRGDVLYNKWKGAERDLAALQEKLSACVVIDGQAWPCSQEISRTFETMKQENERLQQAYQTIHTDKCVGLESRLKAAEAVIEAARKLPEMECKNIGKFNKPHCAVCGFYEALKRYDEEVGK